MSSFWGDVGEKTNKAIVGIWNVWTHHGRINYSCDGGSQDLVPKKC